MEKPWIQIGMMVLSMELPNLETEDDVDYEKNMVEMFQDAQTSFYEGCPTSCLVTILLLLNLCITHGVNSTFIDELLYLPKVDLFPKDNTFPKSFY